MAKILVIDNSSIARFTPALSAKHALTYLEANSTSAELDAAWSAAGGFDAIIAHMGSTSSNAALW